MKKYTICLLLVLLLLLPCGCGQPADSLETAMEQTAAYLLESAPAPTVNAVAGDWTVLGLARSGQEVPQAYFDRYYENVTDVVRQCGGRLDSRKYTEYSRVILALRAIGKNPADVGGYDLLEPLGDFDQTVWQGVNGAIWALIALDSGKETRGSGEMYLEEILRRQLPDGGWTLAGNTADPDMTAMALQALANHLDQPEVQTAVERGLDWLSRMQDGAGGYSYLGVASSESTSQAIVALTSLGIPLEDSRFVKNGHTLLDNLLQFRLENGSFAHALDGTGENLMATEQAFYAMAAAWRAEQGMSALYRMEKER